MLEAAHVRLDVVEFQARPEAGAPPPSVSNNSVAHPMEQKRTMKTCSSSDAVMGDELEARESAEPAKVESEFSSSVAEDQDTDMLTQPAGSSNNKELRGQQDYHDI